jgi:hypothetical protein
VSADLEEQRGRFEALIREELQRVGGRLQYFFPLGQPRRQLPGWFALVPFDDGSFMPQAVVLRWQDTAHPGEPLEELATLAYVFGQFLASRRGLRGVEYERVRGRLVGLDGCLRLDAQLSEDEKRLALKEEERAWELGREALRELGFTAWAGYDKLASDGVELHRQVLGLAAPGS